MQNQETPLILGRINGVFGVKGWIKILSFTRPRENILNYDPLWICVAGDWQPVEVEATQKRGDRLLMKLVDIDTPEQARQYNDCELGIRFEQLPDLPEGDFYWHQLIGLEVYDLDGAHLGQVVDIKETGANDVLVIKSKGTGKSKILIPLVMDIYVKNVDLDAGRLQVDWQQEA